MLFQTTSLLDTFSLAGHDLKKKVYFFFSIFKQNWCLIQSFSGCNLYYIKINLSFFLKIPNECNRKFKSMDRTKKKNLKWYIRLKSGFQKKYQSALSLGIPSSKNYATFVQKYIELSTLILSRVITYLTSGINNQQFQIFQYFN